MNILKYILISFCLFVTPSIVVHAEESTQLPATETPGSYTKPVAPNTPPPTRPVKPEQNVRHPEYYPTKNPEMTQIREDREGIKDDRKEAVKKERTDIRSDIKDIRTGVKSGSTTRPEAVELKKQRVQEGRETIEKTREDARAQLEEKRAALKEEIEKNREGHLKKTIEIMLKRYNAAYERLLQIQNRVTEHIAKVEANGQSVTTAKTELEKAKIILATVPATIASFKATLEAAAAAPEDISKKEVIKTQSEAVKKALKEAHEALIKAVIALKPGKPERPAATTTPGNSITN